MWTAKLVVCIAYDLFDFTSAACVFVPVRRREHRLCPGRCCRKWLAYGMEATSQRHWTDHSNGPLTPSKQATALRESPRAEDGPRADMQSSLYGASCRGGRERVPRGGEAGRILRATVRGGDFVRSTAIMLLRI